jgi:hypothetical protein
VPGTAIAWIIKRSFIVMNPNSQIGGAVIHISDFCLKAHIERTFSHSRCKTNGGSGSLGSNVDRLARPHGRAEPDA